MLYWGIMGLLIAVALGLIVAIVVTLRKNSRRDDDYDYEYENEYEDEVDDYEAEEPQPVRAQKKRREEHEPEPERQSRRPEEEAPSEDAQPPKKTKRQWKVILENLDTWEKFSYTFYDNVGIGRTRTDGEFERFLSIKEDPRVSKVHCVILRQEEKLCLMDMGSRNGTYLNGERIYEPKEIQRDDVIQIGETQIEVKKVLRERE